MVAYDVEQLEGKVRGALLQSTNSGKTGVIVLGGSSGRVDTTRAGLFANIGARALALHWFGGANQPPGICEIPLETFVDATDLLISRGCDRIVFVGTSKGAEAALLASTIDHRINVVIAVSPSSVVWGNIGAGVDGISWPERSSWSFKGSPLDFVPADIDWQKDYRDGLVSYRSFFEKCLSNDVQINERARIPVESSPADLILVAGGDDALWPSGYFARQILQSRQAHGRQATLIFDKDAGHRILLPGETTQRSKLHAHGGSDEADAKLGQNAWRAIRELL
ncbi:acyl-CoA thioester hydrolase/BAAT C-terminal domain-containing protein [Agrobacterium tumefaciens]|uniref:acyl-CoA thioester hydrolase/BAAT C-terminal domain-containing protein n=1 Tax=Agrobacterium tumefaciens TaxID=358 RepID=UPI0021D2A920|nr:acyl-CoA thioester hydrolase/BAAT C-terminal domain-containing protein [Agrobacterium tumefaciens]UXS45923.1 acyl-CoA thioesterase [Agrobacterium tumefaciens]